MSSNRRRGRSPGPPASGKPSPLADTPPEAGVAELTDVSTASEDNGAEAATEAALSAADAASTETASIAEVAAESSPESIQAAVAESVADAAEPAAEIVETAVETTAETAESLQAEAAASVAGSAEQTVEMAEQAVESAATASEEAGVLVAEAVQRVAQAAPTLPVVPPAVAEAVPGRSDKAGTRPSGQAPAVRLGFIPAFEPLNEINATLIAFARGEGEAAVAHFQALTKARTPAEAIRLQVSELQRAADASLTCFSHILRSANRLGGPARWH